MIQIVYRRHKRGEQLEKGYEDLAYFPTWRAALRIIALWASHGWVYEIRTAERVDYDPDKLHPDCHHYRHLWEGKDE